MRHLLTCHVSILIILNGEWYAGFSIVILNGWFELRLIRRQCFEFDPAPDCHSDETFPLEKYEIEEFEDHYILTFFEGGELAHGNDVLRFKMTKN